MHRFVENLFLNNTTFFHFEMDDQTILEFIRLIDCGVLEHEDYRNGVACPISMWIVDFGENIPSMTYDSPTILMLSVIFGCKYDHGKYNNR